MMVLAVEPEFYNPQQKKKKEESANNQLPNMQAILTSLCLFNFLLRIFSSQMKHLVHYLKSHLTETWMPTPKSKATSPLLPHYKCFKGTIIHNEESVIILEASAMFWVGKGTCHQAWWPEAHPQNSATEWKERTTIANCPLTSEHIDVQNKSK